MENQNSNQQTSNTYEPEVIEHTELVDEGKKISNQESLSLLSKHQIQKLNSKPKKKRGILKIVFIVLVAVVLVASGIFAYFYFFPKTSLPTMLSNQDNRSVSAVVEKNASLEFDQEQYQVEAGMGTFFSILVNTQEIDVNYIKIKIKYDPDSLIVKDNNHQIPGTNVIPELADQLNTIENIVDKEAGTITYIASSGILSNYSNNQNTPILKVFITAIKPTDKPVITIDSSETEIAFIKDINNCGKDLNLCDKINYFSAEDMVANIDIIDRDLSLKGSIYKPFEEDRVILVGTKNKFSANSKGGVTPHSYQWNFGESGVAEGKEKTMNDVVFNKAGIYDITLTVTDFSGASTEDTIQIEVYEFEELEVNADIISPKSKKNTIAVGDSINFKGKPAGIPNFKHEWDFSDSGIEKSIEQNPGEITFDQPGKYKITYTVTDQIGDQDSDFAVVIVGEGE